MEFSKAELEILKNLNDVPKSISELASSIKKSNKQTYRYLKKLQNKGMITYKNSKAELQTHSFASLLSNFLVLQPHTITILSDAGLTILKLLFEPKNISELIEESGYKRSTVFQKLKRGKSVGLIIERNGKYNDNFAVWREIKDFISAYKIYEENIDERIPINSKIYFKNKNEILFSNKQELDAALTAFSAYEKFGIKLLLRSYYYYIPKKDLSKTDIFLHSLIITEKEKDTQQYIFIALFYLKYKKELKSIKHPIIDKLTEVLSGQKIDRYPTFKEIKDRAEIYNIEVKL